MNIILRYGIIKKDSLFMKRIWYIRKNYSILEETSTLRIQVRVNEEYLKVKYNYIVDNIPIGK